MVDNVTLEATGTPGAVAATDDIGGVHYQRIKITWGTDGNAADASATNPLPVEIGTGATGAAKVEDVAAANADVGIGILTVRQDSISGSSSTDGDYQFAKSNSVGRIYVAATVDAALPAGTNNIGDVDVLSIAAGDNNIGNVDVVTLPALVAGTANIGDVDVLTVPADPFGANADGASATGSISAKLRFIAATGIPITALPTLAAVTTVSTVTSITNPVTVAGAAAEDAAASGNPVLIGGRYDSSPRTLETGDVGALALNESGQVLVEIASGAGSGGTAAADDADFVDGTTSGTPAMGVYESSPSTVTDGDMGIVGITANRELKVSVSSGGIAGIPDDAAFAPGTSEVLPIGFTFDDAAVDSVNEGDIGAARMSANRCQYVQLRDAAGNERGLNIDAAGNVSIAAITTSLTPGTAAANLGKAEDAAHSTGDVGVMALAVRSDTLAASSGTTGDYEPLHTDSIGALWVRNSLELVDDAAFTPGTSRVLPIGMFADEAATDSVDEGDIGAPRMTLDRKQIVTNYVHAAAGGATPYKNLDVDESEDAVKATPGKLFWLHAMNLHASAVRYLKFYDDTVANVTVGTTVPVLTFAIPPNTDGFTLSFGNVGLQFAAAITIAATTGFADNDTGAPGTNEVIVNLGYA